MTFYWFDLLQLLIYGCLLFGAYKAFTKRMYKTVVAIAGLIVVTFFLSPVNLTKDGYGSIEASQQDTYQVDLPEKIIVEKETKTFEERVKEDIQSYREERNYEND